MNVIVIQLAVLSFQENVSCDHNCWHDSGDKNASYTRDPFSQSKWMLDSGIVQRKLPEKWFSMFGNSEKVH